MKLENWTVIDATDKKNVRLSGRVYGHEKFSDGESIFTSFVIGKEEDRVKTSSGSVFELGNPSRKYLSEVPDAKEKLLARL